MHQKHNVVIIGGGFGGLYAAQALKKTDVEITLVDKRNFHLFQPLLYQVATGGLSPADISSPLRAVLNHQKNVTTILGEVIDFDPVKRKVILRDDELPYDTLIVATGMSHSYFGNDHWEREAPGLKTIENATEMRRKIFLAFEAAERENDPTLRKAWLNFVIVGAGPTGVELAGALAELAYHTLKKDFRSIDTTEANIYLVEGTDRVLGGYPDDLSSRARSDLEKLGVTVKTNTFVTDVNNKTVAIKSGDQLDSIPTRTVLWAAGVQASPLSHIIAERYKAERDKPSRILVEQDLTVSGHPELMIIGDLAHFKQDRNPLPGVAPVAMAQGRYAAKRINAQLKGKSIKPFRYFDKGTMAVIGRSSAVANIKGWHVAGFPAWLMWIFVHIMYLVEYDNRVIVLFQWAWNYFTKNRGARLITHQDLIALKERSRN